MDERASILVQVLADTDADFLAELERRGHARAMLCKVLVLTGLQ